MMLREKNSLETDQNSCKLSWKHKRLKHVWNKLDVRLISLTEIQFNPLLLNSSCNMSDTLFQSNAHSVELSNGTRELI